MPGPLTPEEKLDRATADLLVTIRNTNWLVRSEILGYQARNLKMKYDSLIRSGFSEGQAIYFCNQPWQS